jgi:hypothetical protein
VDNLDNNASGRVNSNVNSNVNSPNSHETGSNGGNTVSMEAADEAFYYDYFRLCGDVTLHTLRYGKEPRSALVLIYCGSMADQKELSQFIIPRLEGIGNELTSGESGYLADLTALPLSLVKDEDEWLTVTTRLVFSGQLIVVHLRQNAVYTMDISDMPGRKPEESAMEPSIKGPRDGFIENLDTNIALIRKRLRTRSFCVELFNKGKRGQTKLALLYMQDIINPDILKEIRGQIELVDQDAVIGTSMVERMVIGRRLKSLFPVADTTGRADYVADSLLNGRFVLMSDGSPMATIAPATLFSLLKSSEDANMPFHIVSMQRVLRYIGLLISLFLPGFFVGLTSFNLDQVPLPLLATIANTRQGLPMPVGLEAFLMLVMFDIFAEAGRRLPRAIGQTVTVVGGIIIGDASIRAGITSPTVIVMISISIIASYTLVDPILNGTVAQLRFLILGCASFFGLFGFMMAFLLLLVHLSSLEHFGVPYLSPVTPFNPKDFLAGILMRPSMNRVKRPDVLDPVDQTSGLDRNR